MDTQIQWLRIYSQDKGMEFTTEQCVIEKSLITEGVDLPNQKWIKTCGEWEHYNYLGILKVGTIKQAEIKEEITNEYLKKKSSLNQTLK